MILLEFYFWTVFFSFMFYVMIKSATFDKDVEFILKYKEEEINPVWVFFIPVVNLAVMVYEVIFIVETIKQNRK